MTAIDRIARTLDAIGPFPARLRRPTRVPVTVLSCDEAAVLVELELVTGPWQGYAPPSALLDIPPAPPLRTPESVRVRELLAEAPRTVAEMEAVVMEEGLNWPAVAPVVSTMAKRHEVTAVATERYRTDGGRWRTMRRWELVTR